MPVNIVKSSGTFTPQGYSEKGTFLPVLFANETEITGLTYITQTGYWTRSNNIVHLTFYIACKGVDLTPYSSSILYINGLDNAPKPENRDHTGIVATDLYDSINKRPLMTAILADKRIILLNDSLAGLRVNQLTTQDITDTPFYLYGGITYNLDGEYEFTKEDVVNLIYPVGSIFMNVNNTNPSILFPGTTWVAWGEGKVPVGVSTSDTDFNTSEKTGGNKTVSGTYSHSHEMAHTHSVSHNHTLNAGHAYIETTSQYLQYAEKTNTPFTPTWAIQGVGSSGVSPPYDASSSTKLGGTTDTSTPTTSGQSNTSTSETNINISTNVIQPYITCYMWKRTA